MTLRHLEIFRSVCQAESITLAAEHLNMTQPAVSQHIKYLERYYGKTLFVYENKKLHLTDAGKILYDRLETLNNNEKMIKEEISASASNIKKLSIGVTMTVGEYAMIQPLTAFLKEYPDINVHIYFGNTTELLDMMFRGKINLALVEGYYPKDEYESVNYSHEKYIAVCAANHEFRNGIPKKLGDLVDERLLIREKGSGTRNILEKNLEARGLAVSDFIHYTEVENMHTIIGLLERDCGISFLYQIAAEEQIKNHSLKEICLNDFNMEYKFDFIWEKGSIYSEEYRILCEKFISFK